MVCQLGAFMQKFGIEGTPTFLVFNNGKVVDEMLGKADDSTLHAFISPHVPSL
jgi:thioredoxin-like negative regulator of GroEL